MTNELSKLRNELEELELKIKNMISKLQELSLKYDLDSMVEFKRITQDLTYLKSSYDIQAIKYKTMVNHKNKA